jgi:hypothetical protein
MAIISVEGFYDMHLHSAPAPFRRIGDSVDIAEWCAAAGMGGIVIKSHFESTVSKAHHAAREVKGLRVFAGIGLNRGVGGVNPGAVEIALHLGAKVVWLPTFDSDNHARVFGRTGTYGFASMTLNFKGGSKPRGRFTVLSDGKLTEDAKEVIELVRDYDAVLATGHLSKEEIFAVMDHALAIGMRKLLITHPEYTVPNLDIDTAVQLARNGAFMEFCGASCFPVPDVTTIEHVKEMIEAVGFERAILSSDSGQPFNPKPPETLRVFLQCLHERGMSEEALRQMGVKNPEYLLGV